MHPGLYWEADRMKLSCSMAERASRMGRQETKSQLMYSQTQQEAQLLVLGTSLSQTFISSATKSNCTGAGISLWEFASPVRLPNGSKCSMPCASFQRPVGHQTFTCFELMSPDADLHDYEILKPSCTSSLPLSKARLAGAQAREELQDTSSHLQCPSSSSYRGKA